ncbi:hypothetical protein KF947_21315 [Halomonas sp. FeN2]|uniref:hypothetical protein n=1 Tax=Halomonas sp. FeN2 TaxID=2832500 RepID=UPI001D0A0BBA|nr:hypothetical protein [Halomonas sp. FeN2]UBR49817.1 hypothetical protein KF947_21315 [Halomonas sp. FeN2]
MISTIVSALGAAGIHASESSEADPSRADTAPFLVALVDPVVSGQLWPLNLPADAPETNGVYQLAGWSSVEVDGYRLGRVDTYVLSLRAKDFDPLRLMTTALIDRVADHAGNESWEITDAATDYEFDQRQYRAHFELQCATLASSHITTPASFVHRVTSLAAPNSLATFEVSQTVTEQVAIVLVASQSEIDTQRQVISTALLGLELGSEAVSPLEYERGDPVASSGRYVYWREVYRYQRLIHSD